mgnify:CR=1 FL=1
MNVKMALKTAVSTFKNPPTEGLVSDDRIRLRHLWYAVELVTGKDPDQALECLFDGLTSGVIEAHATMPSGQYVIISASTWARVNKRDSGWVSGVIYHEHHLPGFVDKLPTVAKKEAEQWLNKFQPRRSAGRPSKQKKAADAYREIYPNGHKATKDREKHALNKVIDMTGETVSATTLRRAIKNH